MRFPFFRNRDSVKNGILISIRRTGDGFHPGLFKRVMVMALAQATKSHEPTYTINDAMDVLLSRLDEAIDDMESDRVQIVEEAWAEIDAI